MRVSPMMSRTTGVMVALALAVLMGPGFVGAEAAGNTPPRTVATRKLPRLVDLGANKCIPCKAMAPILEELKAEYAGRMEVQFIDVWKNPDAARPYGIHIIPTQIFYGPDGKELARHQGFINKEQILAQWKAVGVRL
jgi:thioredoxin 1